MAFESHRAGHNCPPATTIEKAGPNHPLRIMARAIAGSLLEDAIHDIPDICRQVAGTLYLHQGFASVVGPDRLERSPGTHRGQDAGCKLRVAPIDVEDFPDEKAVSRSIGTVEAGRVAECEC